MLFLALPLGWAFAAALVAALNADAWLAFVADIQTPKALLASLWTGIAASFLATAGTAWLLSKTFPGPGWPRLLRLLGPMLAVPHAAYAIGLMALLAPSGWLLRALSPWATGFSSPPAWVTTQDPLGLGLIVVLVFKEIPFLLWAAASQLQRADAGQRLTRELALARSLGYGASQAWWRVVWPQLWPRLRWPMMAVLAYGLTVVDVALVIGPTSPPTLSVLAWSWLQDADLALNAQGVVAAWALAGLLALLVIVFWQLPGLPFWRGRWTSGNRGALAPLNPHRSAARSMSVSAEFAVLLLMYLAVIFALLAGSVSGVWAFPELLPQTLTWDAWASVASSFGSVSTTLTLALASTATGLVWSVAWLEFAPPNWDQRLRKAIYLPLLMPSVVWIVGVHGLTLAWDIDATWTGVWIAHSLATLPYILIALSPAYLGFDVRYWSICASMGRSRAVFLLQLKWPLLRAAIASAAAVGFAVSVAQYLPTLFIGAGRLTTVTTEAVTLASGAQRSLTSAYAALQWLLPVLGFGLAAWLGQARRFAANPR